MSEKFKALLVEGIFNTKEDLAIFKKSGFCPWNTIVVDEGEGKKDLESILSPYIGENISFAAHHTVNPDTPLLKGFGSCLAEGNSWCVFEHHKHPSRAFSFNTEGVLRQEDHHLYVEKFDGRKDFIPLFMLVGHRGRIAAATVFDVEKMKETVFSHSDLKDQMSEMMEMIEKLRGS